MRCGPDETPPPPQFPEYVMPTTSPTFGRPRISLQRGATTVYFLVSMLLIFGFMALATDFGRLYLIQGELQTAADAAALASATQLSGTVTAPAHAADQLAATFDSTNGNDNRF